MSFLHILLDLKELYQGLLGVGIGFVQPPPDPTGAQHPSAWVGPGEAQDVINFLATASFDGFAVHFKDKGGVGRNVRRRAILAVGHSSRNGQRPLVTHLHPKHIHVPPLITWPDPTLNSKGFPDI